MATETDECVVVVLLLLCCCCVGCEGDTDEEREDMVRNGDRDWTWATGNKRKKHM